MLQAAVTSLGLPRPQFPAHPQMVLMISTSSSRQVSLCLCKDVLSPGAVYNPFPPSHVPFQSTKVHWDHL